MRHVLDRLPPTDTAWVRLAGGSKRTIGGWIHATRDTAIRWAAIGPDTRRGRRFGELGRGSVICFPHETIMNERYISIGSGSWLGHGTVVLPGAQIGKHVVIGANSVVSGTIPDFSIAVGAPARVVKRQDAE